MSLIPWGDGEHLNADTLNRREAELLNYSRAYFVNPISWGVHKISIEANQLTTECITQEGRILSYNADIPLPPMDDAYLLLSENGHALNARETITGQLEWRISSEVSEYPKKAVILAYAKEGELTTDFIPVCTHISAHAKLKKQCDEVNRKVQVLFDETSVSYLLNIWYPSVSQSVLHAASFQVWYLQHIRALYSLQRFEGLSGLKRQAIEEFISGVKDIEIPVLDFTSSIERLLALWELITTSDQVVVAFKVNGVKFKEVENVTLAHVKNSDPPFYKIELPTSIDNGSIRISVNEVDGPCKFITMAAGNTPRFHMPVPDIEFNIDIDIDIYIDLEGESFNISEDLAGDGEDKYLSFRSAGKEFSIFCANNKGC